MKRKLTHLLKPKEFRVWCRPNAVPGDFDLTNYPHQATCVVCINAWKFHNGIPGTARASHLRDFNTDESGF